MAREQNSQVRWNWQSNPNPWDTNEKEQWTPYSEAESRIIEERYEAGYEKTEIGIYVIDFLTMEQKNKDAEWKVRAISRDVTNRFSEAPDIFQEVPQVDSQSSFVRRWERSKQKRSIFLLDKEG